MKILLITPFIVLLLVACGDNADKQQRASTSNSTTEVEAAVTPVEPLAEEPAVKKYSAEAFFETTSFSSVTSSGFAYAPDNNSILISSDESGVFNAYSVDIASKQRTQLTSSTSNTNFGLSYFPNDKRIPFTADRGGDELNHVWGRELDGSERDLTATDKTKASFKGWSEDGSEFYVATNERDAKAFDIYAYNATDYSRRSMFENTDALALDVLSNDGRWLSMTKPRTSADSDVYLKDLNSNEAAKLITSHQGNIAYGVYAFTPDSKHLVLSTNEHGDLIRHGLIPSRAAQWRSTKAPIGT